MININNKSLNYTGTTEIQERYFSSQETCNSLVSGLLAAKKANDPTAIMKKSSEGVTGFTFLCTIPSTSISGEKEIDTIPAVLKWQDETQCKVEQFGARFFRLLGFKAPISYFFDTKHRVLRQLLNHSLKSTPALESLADKVSCLAMPRLHSNNLAHVSEHGLFLKLEESDQIMMIHEFGRIAAMDLLIGNDDRFIEFPSYKEPSVLPKGKINTGNVLVHINKDNQLLGIFPIDNCPSSRLLKKEKRSSGGFDLEGELFDEKSISSPSSLEFSPSSEETPMPEDQINALHSVFVDFYNQPEKYADQFTTQFLAEIKTPSEKFKKLSSLIRSAFLEGIHEQFSSLKLKAYSFGIEVRSWDLLNDGEVHAQKLLTQNLKFLEEQL